MNTLKYPGQPDNEIWFYDKDKPYYQLTNFYASPIECELPIEVIDSGRRYMPLDEKGNLSTSHKHFYNAEPGLLMMDNINKKKWEGLAKKEKAEKFKWHTSEHLYQAFKLTDWNKYIKCNFKIKNGVAFHSRGTMVEILDSINPLAMGINTIREVPNPGEVRNFVNEHFKPGHGLRGDWFFEGNGMNPVVPMRLRAMHFAVREKFNQNPKLKKLLWETKNKNLVEHSPDKFWGDSVDGKGENWLGRILMKIRLEIQFSANRKEWNPSEIEAESPEPNSTNQKDTEHEAKKTLIENNISEIKNKLSSANISTKQVIQILGNSWETNYQMSWTRNSEVEIENHKNSLLAKINQFITNNPNNGINNNNESDNNNNQNQNRENQGTNEPNTPPPPPAPTNSLEPPVPTSEQINQTEEKLDQAQANNVNEEELIRIIKQTSETVKHSGDENLKKKKEEVEKKLSKDKLRELIREEIHQELVENRLKPEELSPTVKQKLDELNNDNSQVIRTEIFNEVGKQVLSKLITALQSALKLSKKKELQNKVKELQQFINSKIDYKQNAYKKEKNKVDQLLVQARNQSDQNQTPVGFFRTNNPFLWLSSILVIGLVVFSTLIVVRTRRKKQR